jgi:hypothetical protein
MSAAAELPLPAFVNWPVFPFQGDLQVRAYDDLQPYDRPRSGEPGGGPCETCAQGDDAYVWVDERWRVRAPTRESGVPVQLFLETRAHLDLQDMDARYATELGTMIVRLDHAIQAVGGIGRVHISRWGDGGSHFHLWLYGRPFGAQQMLGFCLPMWAMILPPTAADIWRHNLAIVARELARESGTAMITE